MVKIKISFIAIHLLFATCTLYSEDIDSLKLILKTSRQDTTLVKTYILLTEICELDEIQDYANSALQLCELNLRKTQSDPFSNSFYLKYQADALNNLGFLAAEKGDIQKGYKLSPQKFQNTRRDK